MGILLDCGSYHFVASVFSNNTSSNTNTMQYIVDVSVV